MPGDSENVKPRMPLTKKGKKRVGGPSDPPTATMTTDSPDGKLDTPRHLNTSDMTMRVTSSGNERFTDAEHTPTGSVKDDVPIFPNLRPPPSLTTFQSRAFTPTPGEPEKPLSLWERKKLKVPSSSAPASGWGSWGSSLVINTTNAATVEWPPSPQLPSVNPKISFTLNPGGSNGSGTDKKPGDTRDDAPEREGTEAESKEEMKEISTPAVDSDIEFDWLPTMKKKGQVPAGSCADSSSTGGGGGGKQIMRKGKK